MKGVVFDLKRLPTNRNVEEGCRCRSRACACSKHSADRCGSAILLDAEATDDSWLPACKLNLSKHHGSAGRVIRQGTRGQTCNGGLMIFIPTNDGQCEKGRGGMPIHATQGRGSAVPYRGQVDTGGLRTARVFAGMERDGPRQRGVSACRRYPKHSQVLVGGGDQQSMLHRVDSGQSRLIDIKAGRLALAVRNSIAGTPDCFECLFNACIALNRASFFSPFDGTAPGFAPASS